jgi:hypothetical protein
MAWKGDLRQQVRDEFFEAANPGLDAEAIRAARRRRQYREEQSKLMLKAVGLSRDDCARLDRRPTSYRAA